MGDGNIDASGDIKTRWMTHPPTENRLEELRSIVTGFQSGDRNALQAQS
jgi:Zn-dependent protease with chaperone function